VKMEYTHFSYMLVPAYQSKQSHSTEAPQSLTIMTNSNMCTLISLLHSFQMESDSSHM
jgi:hypothetical protein